jgi:hypothetical protein
VAKKSKGWSRKSKAVGYAVERGAVLNYKNKGILAIRIPVYQQVGHFRSIDYIVVEKGRIGQAKRRKKYLRKPEIERIKACRNLFPNSELVCELCFRDRGLKFENIS